MIRHDAANLALYPWRATTAVLLCGMLVTATLVATPASAQGFGDDTTGLDGMDDEEEAPVTDGFPPSADMSATSLKEHDRYWADKRKIDAIQKRGFLKEARHEFTLHTGLIPNDEFYMYVSMGGRYSYFFAEDIGVETWATYHHKVETGFKAHLITQGEGGVEVTVPQSVVFLAGIDAVWSPLHGKFAMFDSSLVHFDAYLAFGAGFIMSTIRQTVGNIRKEESDMAGNVGMGFRIFLGDWISLRTDFRQYFYPAWDPDGVLGGKVAHPFEVTVGLSFWTAAPE